MWHIDKWIENYPDYFKNNRKMINDGGLLS